MKGKARPTGVHRRWKNRLFGKWAWSQRHPRRYGHRLRWHLLDDVQRCRHVRQHTRLGPWYWLFVAGCSNSGTTLLTRILSAHPIIRSMPGEAQLLSDAYPRAGEVAAPRCWHPRMDLFRRTEADDTRPLLKAAYDYTYYLPPREGIIMDKSPQHTPRCRWLQRFFRPSRFIFMVRDPLAVSAGIERRSPFALEDGARQWTALNGKMLEDLPHLEHALVVRYEELCEETEAVLAKLETFLELPTPLDSSMLPGKFDIHNIDRRPQPIHNMNTKNTAHLTDQDRERIMAIAGEVAERLGYA